MVRGLWPHGTKNDNAHNTTLDAGTFSHSYSAVAFLCRPEINESCMKSLPLTARADMKSQNITHQKSIRKSQPKSRDFSMISKSRTLFSVVSDPSRTSSDFLVVLNQRE